MKRYFLTDRFKRGVKNSNVPSYKLALMAKMNPNSFAQYLIGYRWVSEADVGKVNKIAEYLCIPEEERFIVETVREI